MDFGRYNIPDMIKFGLSLPGCRLLKSLLNLISMKKSVLLFSLLLSLVSARTGHNKDWAVSLKYFAITMHTFPASRDYPLAIDDQE